MRPVDARDPRGKPTLLDAMERAQRLAFAPLLFQATLELRRRGVLEALLGAPEGLTPSEVAERVGLSDYGARVLLEAGLAAEVVRLEGERYLPTSVGLLVARDAMTRVNFDFSADVCFAASAYLGASLDEGRAVGLAELGPWATVYEGLARLPEPARTSWFSFDHFYSDDSFPLVVPEVLARRPGRVLDVGGNTGKFTRALAQAGPDVRVTIADLPGQIALAREALSGEPFAARVAFHEVDLLGPEAALPGGFDVVWMSQFLCCFSESEVVRIADAARGALGAGGSVFVMDNFWDVQPSAVAALCLQATSLYFTCVANGTSRMYDFRTMERLLARGGLRIAEARHGIGLGHSLLRCEPAG